MHVTENQVRVPTIVAIAYFAERFGAMCALLLQAPPDRSTIRAVIPDMQRNRHALSKYDAQFVAVKLPAPSAIVDECARAPTLSRMGRVRLAHKCAQVGYQFTKMTSLSLSASAGEALAQKAKTAAQSVPSVPVSGNKKVMN